MEDLDEAYREYLWGEASPRTFARKARFGNAKKDSRKQVMSIHVDESVDASRVVPR